jgi:hypothetical protein
MRALMTFLIVCVVTGCAANTGVVPNGQGSYIVAKQAATGFPGLGNLKADALAEANNYCRQQGQGQELFVTRATETQPPYVLGNYPRAEIEFRCGAPSVAADAAVLECNEKRKRGELKSFKASVECSNPKIYAAWKEVGDPNMDLLNLWLAARLVGAENVDKGKITEAEYQLQLAELNSRITDEKRRRSFANVQLASQVQAVQAQSAALQAQSAAALLQGLAALQSASRSPR